MPFYTPEEIIVHDHAPAGADRGVVVAVPNANNRLFHYHILNTVTGISAEVAIVRTPGGLAQERRLLGIAIPPFISDNLFGWILGFEERQRELDAAQNAEHDARRALVY